ncbi:MAG TPA: VanZ family protein [Gemmataceae bacterium]|nr:VanZ family protein [Gemmataceae bacterium]
MLRRVVWLGFALLWTAALVTPQPVRVSQAALPEQAQFPVGKSLHVAAYALLCVLTAWQRFAPRWRPLLLLALSAHAAGTEFVQQFVPLRHGSWEDVALDHVGLYLGVVLAWRWWRE